ILKGRREEVRILRQWKSTLIEDEVSEITAAHFEESMKFARRNNILASNWQAYLSTIKVDANGSKEDIHTSKIKYFFRRGRPYVWIPEKDFHNVSLIIDERGSLAVTNPYPGPLADILRSIKKVPTRVALIGDLVPMQEQRVQLAVESLRKIVLSERKAISEAGYSVSGILNSSSINHISQNEKLQEALDGDDPYAVYKFDIRSCTYIDGSGVTHDVKLDDIQASKADLLSPYSEKLIDGINQSPARRKALMFFCFVHFKTNTRDAFILSVDRKGFDVLGQTIDDQWKQFRFTFKEEAQDIATFCDELVEMEEEALKTM
ncbi:hypothetical protein GIB67_040456, partial [Kingdonia uniflora]